MKMKFQFKPSGKAGGKLAKLCKRAGAISMAAALLVTSGSFSNLQIAKAYTNPESNVTHWGTFYIYAFNKNETDAIGKEIYPAPGKDVQEAYNHDSSIFDWGNDDGTGHNSYIKLTSLKEVSSTDANGDRSKVWRYAFKWQAYSESNYYYISEYCEKALNKGKIYSDIKIAENGGNVTGAKEYDMFEAEPGYITSSVRYTDENGSKLPVNWSNINEYFDDSDGLTSINVNFYASWEKCTHKNAAGKDLKTYKANMNGTHVATCSQCRLSETENCTLTEESHKDATCTEDSTEILKCTACGQKVTTHEAIAKGHTLSNPEFTFSDDGQTVSYRQYCSTCKALVNSGENSTADSGITITSRTKVPATCTTKGTTTYTASVVINGKSYSASKDVVDIPMTDHKWSIKQYRDKDGVEAGEEYQVCADCHTERTIGYRVWIDPMEALLNGIAFTNGYGYYAVGQGVTIEGLPSDIGSVNGYSTPYYEYEGVNCGSTCNFTMPDHPVIVKIVADPNNYIVTFSLKHAAAVSAMSYRFGTGITELPIPTVDNGYEFLGWYDNPDYTGEPITGISDADYGNKELYGKVAGKAYAISYMNGNTCYEKESYITVAENAPKKYTSGQITTLPGKTEVTISNDNYEFDGWYLSADCTGDRVTTINSDESGTKVFYASIEEKGKSDLDDNSGSDQTDDIGDIEMSQYIDIAGGILSGYTASAIDGMVKLPTATQISKTGYAFNGWYTDPELTNGPVTDLSVKQIKDGVKVYAKWISTAAIKTSPSPNPTAPANNMSPNTTKINIAMKEEKVRTVGGIRYAMTSRKTCKVVKATNKKLKKAVVQEKVKFVINGKTVSAKVTSINKNAFKGCKKLKKLTIKSKYIKTIGKQAFKGVSKKCSIKAPKKKYKIYKSCLKKAGFKGKVKK